MKTFTTAVIRGLLNQVYMEEISFSRMVEIMNERVELLNEMAEIVNEMVSEAKKPNFKEGDFLHSDWENENLTLICKKQRGDKIYNHAYKSNTLGVSFAKTYWSNDVDFRPATEAEKQELLDALEKEGKRWNEEKLCVEDIPKRKFKKGDKVRIKDGIFSRTHNNFDPAFVEEMDDLIGKTMTVYRYTDCGKYVACEETEYAFFEDWLEPYEEPKKGDWAIFWDGVKKYAIISIYDRPYESGEYIRHKDDRGLIWANAIKFESKEQYRKLLRGEI